MSDRVLRWEGCANVRDLGGLATEDGSAIRRGALVRSDKASRLTELGWSGLLDHGVTTIVDLRAEEERLEDPPRDVPMEALHISLFGDWDKVYMADLDERLRTLPPAAQLREFYLDALERYRGQVVRAVTAFADAPPGGVLIHCAAGKDRTGIVVALLLRLAGVPVDAVADDYAESEANLEALTRAWADEAPTEEERARRVELNRTPRQAMVEVLAALDERYGGVREYLLAAGAPPDLLERAAARLR
jgi:protein tyrosine/serine phosphatase